MRTSLSPLLALALLTFAVPAMAEDDLDDLDFGIEDDDMDWNLDGKPSQGEPEDDLYGLESDPVEDFDELEEDFGAFEDPDDDPLVGLTDQLGPEDMAKAEPVDAGAKTATVSLDVVGKEPLADNYPARIVAVDRDAVVVELPVLLGRSRAGFEGSPYWLQAEVRVDDQVVATAAQWVGKVSLAEFGPSFAFFELMVPVRSSTGELVIQVEKMDALGAAGTDLFTRSVSYSLK